MLFILLFAVSSVTPLLVSQMKPVFVTGRTTVILCFPFMILAGLFLTRFGDPRVNNVFCIVLALVIGVHTYWSRNLPEMVSDRASAEYLMNNAHEGDIIVFTSLSRSAVEYYFDLNGYRDKFHLLSFPAELDRHPGFRDLEKMTANSSVYSEEAGRLSENLSTEADGKKTVWLLYGIDTEISSFLKKRLEDSFKLQSEVNKPGVFHTSILSYVHK